MAAAPVLELDTASAVLDAARQARAAADREEARLLMLAVDWAAMHSVDSITDAACMPGAEGALPIAGPGAPLVAEFCVHEFAAAIGLPSEVGRTYLGEAVELRHRLPRLWRRVLAGEVQAWRARRVAASTMSLTREAAAYVDVHVAHVAHRLRPSQLDRVVEAAVARYMPQEAAKRAEQAAESRHFTLHTQHASIDGTADLTATLDLADALDLDAAIGHIASSLAACGSEDSLDVRRAKAAGELARRELTLGFGSEEPIDRRMTLHLHVSEHDSLARLDNTRSPVTLDQVKAWCREGRVTVKPVIDLNENLTSPAYVVPDRIRDQVVLRDRTCVFPHCTRSASLCDLDHVIARAAGGTTSSDNLAPLCRSHHRAKTHGGWRYAVIAPATYQWTSPLGHTYLREPPDQ